MPSPSCSPQILQLLSRKVDRDVIEYLLSTTIETVHFALGRPTSRIDTSVILVALVYLERARSRFKICDKRWAYERIMIGALVLAAKYVSDYTIKNARWARWSRIFSKEDIGRMERELLGILDWDLSIAEWDLMAHHEHLSPPAPTPTLPSSLSLKRCRSQFEKEAGIGLELSPFCPPPQQNNATALASKTRALTSSVTLPGFSSFLHNPVTHPPAPSPGSLRLLPPSIQSVTWRAVRPRLATNQPGPRQPLRRENKQWHPVAKPLQQQTNPQTLQTSKPLGFPLTWPQVFDPFLPYIPPVSFYQS